MSERMTLARVVAIGLGILAVILFAIACFGSNNPHSLHEIGWGGVCAGAGIIALALDPYIAAQRRRTPA